MSEKTTGTTASARQAPSCEIQWHEDAGKTAEEMFNAARRTNLLQSRTYGLCMAGLNNQRVKRGIIRLDGLAAGTVQTLEAGMFRNAVHAAIIDRAPVWLEPYGAPEHFAAFAAALRAHYPKRLGRRVRFIPECEDTPQNLETLIRLGFRKRSKPYRTLWWDLSPPLEHLRAALKPKWRGHLNKAGHQNLKITWDENGRTLGWFIAGYEKDKAQRNYGGPAARTLSVLAQAFLQRKNALIGCASLDGQPLAGVLIFCHGQSATYQAGWTTPAGRRGCAHHILLWGAARVLKERDIYDFDLGGVEAEQEGGLKTFKEGTGGQVVQTPGLWI